MLRFGYNAGIPMGTATVWGCRAVMDVNGRVDVPDDRQDAVGPRVDALLDHLNNHIRGAWRDRAAELVRNRVMSPHAATDLVLYHDDLVMIKGNTQGSDGYLYVCAFFLTEGDEE